MISAKVVKELRDSTGAGMMDCKNALQATDGDVKKALEHLRKAGIAKAQKKSGRSTLDGTIEYYIHQGGKLGVLLSIDTTKEKKDIINLGKQLAMQVASSSPLAIEKEGLDPNILKKEKEIITEELKNSGKDIKIIEKIALGKLNKFIGDNTLLNQEWIMEPKKKVRDVIKEFAGKDKFEIKKFVRFKIGEGL